VLLSTEILQIKTDYNNIYIIAYSFFTCVTLCTTDV